MRVHVLNCVYNTELLHANSREQFRWKVACKKRENGQGKYLFNNLEN